MNLHGSREARRNQFLGLDETISIKSYYPQLNDKLQKLEESQYFLEQKTNALGQMLIDLENERRKLELSEARYRTLLENIPGAVYRVDADHPMNFLFVSDYIRQITGLKAEACLREPWLFAAGITVEDGKRILSIKGDAVARQEPFELQYAFRDFTGVVHWIHDQGRVVSDGTRRYIDGVMIDATEQVQAADQTVRSEANLREVFNSTRDAFIIHDGEGVILDGNDQMKVLYGLQERDIRQYRIRDLSGRLEDAALAEQTLWKQVLAGEMHSFEWECIQPLTGATFSGEVHLRRIHWFGELRILAVVRDISERKRSEAIIQSQMQELEAKNSELERFTYTVSHDLKSPLITIKGFLGFLDRDIQGQRYDRVQKDILRIMAAADKMQSLLEDLLELSRVGRMVQPPVVVDLNQLVPEVVEMIHGQLEARNIRLVLPAVFPVIRADRMRMMQVWQNLLVNAVKFSGESSVIEVATWQNDSHDVFSVKDYGVGIDPAYHQRIFGLFDKLDPHSEGNGIGLALVRRVVELHGGEVWVESEGEGLGATFVFTIAREPENNTDLQASGYEQRHRENESRSS